MTERCVFCDQPVTARHCRAGDGSDAHLMSWELDLIRRRRLVKMRQLQRDLRDHTPVWERDVVET